MAAGAIARRTEGNDLRLELGEGPVWDDTAGVLWWVDSEAGAVFHGTLDGDRITVAGRQDFGEKVGSVSPAADGGLLVAGERHVHVLDPDGRRVDSIRVLDDAVQSRLNDSACDPRGRFLVGSVRLDGRSRQEQLVSIDADRTVRAWRTGSPSRTASGSPRTARRCTTSTAARARCSRTTTTSRPVPRAGGAWCSSRPARRTAWRWTSTATCGSRSSGRARSAACLPEATSSAMIDVPVPHPTCPEFAGPGLDTLVITTALLKMSASERAASPDSGAIFVVDPGVRGLPARLWSGSTSG